MWYKGKEEILKQLETSSKGITNSEANKRLKEEGLNWDKTKILVIPCESEKEAYRIENSGQNGRYRQSTGNFRK